MKRIIGFLITYCKKKREHILHDFLIGTIVVVLGIFITVGIHGCRERKIESKNFDRLLAIIDLETADNLDNIEKIKDELGPNTNSTLRLSDSILQTVLQSSLFHKYSTPCDQILLLFLYKDINACNNMLDILTVLTVSGKDIEHRKKHFYFN